MLFDLIDVAPVNIYIVYTKRGNNTSLLNFKIVVGEDFIGRYSNRKRFFLTKWKYHEPPMPREVPTHMSEF